MQTVIYFAVLCIIASVLLVPITISLLRLQRRFLRENFKGQLIVTSAGVGLTLTLTAVTLAGCGMDVLPLREAAFLLTIALLFTGLGFVDDLWGTGDIHGWRGHLRVLLSERRVTTGMLKALGGGAGSLLLACWYAKGIHALWGAVLIAISANGINMLDKRPSRALKVFWMLALIELIISPPDMRLLLLPILLATFVYAANDFRCRAMLGDAGSNMLGAELGAYAWLATPVSFQIVLGILWVAFHIYAEKRSLTEDIAKVQWLRWWDEWGVR